MRQETRDRRFFSRKNGAVVRRRKDLKGGARRGGANRKKWRAPSTVQELCGSGSTHVNIFGRKIVLFNFTIDFCYLPGISPKKVS